MLTHRHPPRSRALIGPGVPPLRWCALALLLGASPAVAQSAAGGAPAGDESPAKAAYRQGVEFFKNKQFADAIREFNKAYRLDPNPVLVFNMARAFEELKQYGSAIEYYRKYLEMSPNAPDRPTVEDSIRTLEILQKQEAVQVLVPLTVTSRPDGARVFLDGREIGVTPLKSPVPAGRHFLALEADGYERSSSEVEIKPEEPPTREVVLVAKIGPAVGPAPEGGLSRRTWAWISMGLGAALGAGGGLAGWQARKKEGKLDDIDANPALATKREYDDIRSEGKTFALVADGLFVGGALGLGTGVVLLLTGGDAE